MYSSRAVVTASFLVRWPPLRRASSMRLSSMARLVGMYIASHIDVCGARKLGAQKRSGTVVRPRPLTAPTYWRKLLDLVEFHTVAGMYVFHGENDHAGCSGRRHPNHHDLTDGTAGKIAYVDHRPVGFREHVRIDRGRLFLCVFGNCGFERK